MSTSPATFALMARLTPAERAEIECRYDGPIPEDAVRAVLARRDQPDLDAHTRAYAAARANGQSDACAWETSRLAEERAREGRP